MTTKDLPDGLIVEILSWLPVKCLMRFKCVSKPWLQLISTDQSFMKLHFNRSIQVSNYSNPNPSPDPGIMIFLHDVFDRNQFLYTEDYAEEDYAQPTLFETPFSHPMDQGHRFQSVNACNGLLCVIWYFQGLMGFKDEFMESSIHVWNPFTGDHITIPSPPVLSHFRTMFGFGYSEASDEYKLIRFLSPERDQSYVLNVYTLGKDGSWRTLPEEATGRYTPHTSVSCSTQSLLHGALHFFATKSNGEETIVAFTMQDEVLKEIPKPKGISHDKPGADVSVEQLGGLLCISYLPEFPKDVEIWVMNEYGVGDSWTKLYNIPSRICHFSTQDFLKTGEIIILTDDVWELILYDPNTYSVKRLPTLKTHATFDIQRSVSGAFVFKESLFSPTIINGTSTIKH